jgi:hypothetical protein
MDRHIFKKRLYLRPIGLMAFVLLLILAAGCQKAKVGPGATDPALAALGRASVKILAERMEGQKRRPDAWPEAWPEVFDRPYVLSGNFEGPASQVVLALSGAVGYGFMVKNAKAGGLTVRIKESGLPAGRDMVWLIRDLNHQLKPHKAFIGVDAVNKKLILFGPEAD